MLSTPTEPPAPSQSSAVQIVGDNISMPHNQGIDITNTGPTSESLAISYNNNQSIDPDLWNNVFSPISLIRIKNFLSSNAPNIICLLLRIEMFIKQYSLDNKPVKNFPELVEIGVTFW